MIFGVKAEYKKEELPFCYIKNKEDIEAGGITIEAYGEIDGEMKFLSATFVLSDLKMYDRNDYEDMIRVIEETKNKKVSLDLRYKKERLVGFNLDSESLAKNLNDERFNKIEILITGIDDKSAANRGV
ncbi:hypothetical protein DW944_05820 [Eubacterium ventriosum]|uniref:Uncharacterized protein n=1 Tax=Eubacterium ventriosum TaxID=39496 RepID=A0A413R8H4_9FIRM|nr:hypothetical protein [Eubacterium ventriosum]RHA18591.1 hypothetical protein DW944_05820 [Eubacterium ventriosum]RHB17564.1 hypothetical protein DW893_05655 [Eubacterium ventriosum]